SRGCCVELDLSGCECIGAESHLQELAAFHAAGSCPSAQPRSVGVACADGALIARSDRTLPCPDITSPERNPLHVVGEHVERHLGRYVTYPPPLAGPSPPLAARSTLAMPYLSKGAKGQGTMLNKGVGRRGFSEPVLADQFQRNGVILDHRCLDGD